MNKENEKYYDELLRLLEKVYSDYLLLNRMIYKVKNLFFRQKQFKYIVQLKKMLSKYVFDSIENLIETNLDSKKNLHTEPSNYVINTLKEILLLKEDNLKDLCDLMEKIGMMIKEMLKLKLYLPYSLVMLNIISRLYILFKQIQENKEKLVSSSILASNELKILI